MKKNHSLIRRGLALLMCCVLSMGFFPAGVARAMGDDALTLKDKGSVTYDEATTHDGVTFKTLYGKKVSEESGRMSFGELRYWVYLPEDYNAQKDYPMVVYLHSSNLCYNQTFAQSYTPWTQTLNLNSSTNPLKVADKLHDVLGDYIIYVPQCPGDNSAIVSGSSWTTMAGNLWKSATKAQMDSDTYSAPTDYLLAAENMIGDYIANGVSYDGSTYGVDANRVYLIGDSMGGIGAYTMLADCPDTFAGAVIRAGMGNTTKVDLWKDTPMFIAHGTADTNVPYERGQDMIDALEAAGAKDVQTLILEGAPHDVRPQLYTLSPDGGETYTVFTWLAQQSRADYVIDSWEDYDNLRNAVNSGDAAALDYVSEVAGISVATAAEAAKLNVSLEADLTIDEPGAGIGTGTAFAGNFDGNGHTVTFDIDCAGEEAVNTSLFGTVNGTVRNVKLDGAIAYTDSALAIGTGIAMSGTGSLLQRIAPLATFSAATSHVENVVSDVDITYTDEGAAEPDAARHLTITGLVGYHQGTMLDCEVSGDIDITTAVVRNLYVGGVTQAPMKTMQGVVHSGDITLSDTTSTGTNCYIGGFGALLGGTAFTAVDCVNSGDITVATTSNKTVRAGGFIGSKNAAKDYLFTDCANTGDISVTARRFAYVGGIIGESIANQAGSVKVSGFNGSGDVKVVLNEYTDAATTAAGGIVGRVNAGAVQVDTSVVEGLVQISAGSAEAKLANQLNVFAGGMIGYAASGVTLTMEDCLVTSNVRATCNSAHASSHQKAGGYVGTSAATAQLSGCFYSGALGVGSGVASKAAHYAVLNGTGGSATYTGCGHSSNSGAALAAGVGKLNIANLPAEGVVSLSGMDLMEGDAPVWQAAAGSELPEALGFTGKGVSLNDEGNLCYAEDGEIEVNVTWCGEVLGSATVTVNVCQHTYGDWQHTDEDSHTRSCGVCGDEQTEEHAYTDNLCVCGRTENGEHQHVFSEEYLATDANHYRYCTWPGCEEIADAAKHTYENGACTVCGREAIFSEEGHVYEMATAEDYAVLLKAVNDGDAEALSAIAKKLAGEWYVDGMSVTQDYAAKLNVLQTADIELSYSGAEGEVKPVGIGTDEVPFSGDYDGDGYTITFADIALSGEAVENIALFGYVKGDISNVDLAGSISYSDDLLKLNKFHVAPLAAYPSGNAIENCTADVDITYDNGTTDTPDNTTALYISGLLGQNKADSVKNCSVSGDLNVTNGQALSISVGGVTAQLYMIFEDVEYSGAITVNDTRASTLFIGGIGAEGGINANASAEPGSSIKGLENNGAISVSASGRNLADSALAMVYAGGIIARNATSKNWKLEDCVNNGDILISGGHSDGKNAAGSVINDNGYIGGLLGYSATDIIAFENCENNGNIKTINNGTGNDRSNYNVRMGGFVGSFNNTSGRTITFIDCANSGDIHAENVAGAYWRSTSNLNFAAGGFVGEVNAAANTAYENCTNTGDLSSIRTMNIFLGGFIGDSRGAFTAKNVENAGNIHSHDYTYTTSCTGGFAGVMRGNATIDGFTNTGAITASTKSSANTGTVTAVAGGVVGQAFFTVHPTIVMDELEIGGTIEGKTNNKGRGFAGYIFGRISFNGVQTDAQCITLNYHQPTAVCTAEQEAKLQGLVGLQESCVRDLNFSITLIKPQQTVTAQDVSARVGDSGVSITASTTGDGALSYEVISGEDIVSVDENGKLTFLKKGSATIRVTAAETENFAEASVEITVTVKAKKTSSDSASTSKEEHKITFETNGGSELKSLEKSEGTKVDLSEYIPEKEGYIFAGWYADKKLSEKLTTIEIGKDTTLYAKWVEEMAFTDISESATYFYDSIEWAYVNGYMIGRTDTFFDEQGDVTREQIWMVLGRLNGVWPKDMAEARSWAMEQGVSDGTRPLDGATRQEMVTLLWKAAGKPEADESLLDSWPDSAKVADYARSAMAWAIEQGIVKGTAEGTLDAASNVTRGQFAGILSRHYQ